MIDYQYQSTVYTLKILQKLQDSFFFKIHLIQKIQTKVMAILCTYTYSLAINFD
jgi:hypothetical protein